MRSLRRLMILLAGMAFALPLLASHEPTSQELQTNRLLLKRWRSDPDHYARLKSDLKEFLELPAEKKDALRRFDRELHDENPKTQERLWRVLDRYSSWLGRLPEEERRRIEEASEPLERLFIIKDLRQKEWLQRLPRVDRERLEKAQSAELRDNMVASLRREERERRYHIRLALAREQDEPRESDKPSNIKPETKPGPEKTKAYEPTKLAEFPKEVREYFRFSLRPMLSQREQGYLEGAEGQWPSYAKALKTLAAKHPVKVLPARDLSITNIPVSRLMDLPPEWSAHVGPRNPKKTADAKGLVEKERKEIVQLVGKWPDFALAISDVAKSKHWETPKRQLGPCRPEEFQAEVERFIRDDLAKALKDDPNAKEKLKKAEGIWPDYPLLVMELAKKHNLKVPLTYLPEIPGTPGFWNKLPKDDK
ncbi:MAG TPA: hypothetical protein VGZ25_07100 [Gemmataceae bacterium]|nr:hypothetical protein [Gemmataceae bacterium]